MLLVAIMKELYKLSRISQNIIPSINVVQHFVTLSSLPLSQDSEFRSQKFNFLSTNALHMSTHYHKMYKKHQRLLDSS